MNVPDAKEQPEVSPVVLDDAGTAVPEWRVGTLTYTSAGLVVLFCWLLWGDFAYQVKDRSVLLVFQSLIKTYGASDTIAGILVLFLPPALALLLVPIVSYKSDRHRGPWGRRIPFLVATTPMVVVPIIGIAFSPWLGKRLPGHHATLLLLGTFWAVFESATQVAYALFVALVNDVVPRPLLGRFYGLFRAVSLIAGIIFMFWFGKAQAHYVAIFLGSASIYAVGFILMCLKVREGSYEGATQADLSGGPEIFESETAQASPVINPASPRQATTAPRNGRLLATRQYLRDSFAIPYYRWVYAALVLPQLAFIPINGFNLYFSRSVQMSDNIFGKLQSLYFVLSLAQTFPIGWLVDRFDAIRVALVAVVLHGAAALWGGFFAHNATTFGIAYVLTGVLSGTWFTATASMSAALLPKLKFAQYASAITVVFAIGQMALGPAVGLFLDLTRHQYRYVYMIGGIFDVLGLLVTIVLFSKYQRRGGKRNYVAP